LGYPKGFGVLSVASDSPNRSVLQPGDRFVSVDGTKVTDDQSLRKVLAGHHAGDRLDVELIRAGKQQQASAALGTPAAGSSTPRLGITVTTGCLLPFVVTLSLAGTGSIDPTGAVGQIGGISLKMIAARRAGATVFLAPASNCADVRGNIPS